MLKYVPVLSMVLLLILGCQNNSLKSNVDGFLASTPDEQANELTQLIRDRQWHVVDLRLKPCLNVHPGLAIERRCTGLYQNSVVLDEDFQQSMYAWVEEEPDNFHARMILAEMLNVTGWVERGHGYARNTHPFHMAVHYEYQQRSYEALVEALNLQPELSYAYAKLISVLGKNRDTTTEMQQLHRRALTVVPESLEVAKAVLFVSQPRWGGSYAAQNSIMNTYQHLPQPYPHLDLLADYVELMRARDYKDGIAVEKDLDQALAILSLLAEKDYPWEDIYSLQARIYSLNDQMELSRAAILKALEISPNDEFLLNFAGCTCFGLSAEEAISINERYVERFPVAFEGWQDLGYKYYRAERYEEALTAYQRALALRPLHPRTRQYEQWTKDHLGVEYEDFRTTEYYIDLTIYSIPVHDIVENLQNYFISQPESTGKGNARTDTMAENARQYFTVDAFNSSVRERLAALDWQRDTWKIVSTYFSDKANIGQHMKESYRETQRERFSDPHGDHEVGQVWAVYEAVADALAQDFAYRVNAGLSLNPDVVI